MLLLGTRFYGDNFQWLSSVLSIIAAADLKSTKSAFCSLHAFDSSDRFPQRRKPLGREVMMIEMDGLF